MIGRAAEHGRKGAAFRVQRSIVNLAACALLAACGARVEPPPETPTAAHVVTKQEPSSNCSSQPVEQALSRQPSAAVIVLLKDAPQSQQTLDQRQDALLQALGADFQVSRRYSSIPGLAGTLTQAGFARIRANPDVGCIQLDGTGSGA